MSYRVLAVLLLLAACKQDDVTPQSTHPSTGTLSDTDAAAQTGAVAGTGAGGEDTTPPVAETPDQILADCGVAGVDLKNPATVLLAEQMQSAVPIDKTGEKQIPFISTILPQLGDVKYTVHVVPKLSINSTVANTVQTTDFDITADVTPALAQKEVISQAQTQVGPKRGLTTTLGLSTDDRVQLVGDNPEWANALCVIQPTVRMDESYGTVHKTVTFNPPIPDGISPRANAKRYDIELPGKRTFTNIKATISDSNDPAAQSGSVVGQVTIQRLPQATYQAGSVTVQADYAFEVDSDFGPQTEALGIKRQITFFVDASQKRFKAIVVQTGDPDSPTVAFVAQ